jgi:hypothetical protein
MRLTVPFRVFIKLGYAAPVQSVLDLELHRSGWSFDVHTKIS